MVDLPVNVFSLSYLFSPLSLYGQFYREEIAWKFKLVVFPGVVITREGVLHPAGMSFPQDVGVFTCLSGRTKKHKNGKGERTLTDKKKKISSKKKLNSLKAFSLLHAAAAPSNYSSPNKSFTKGCCSWKYTGSSSSGKKTNVGVKKKK